LNQGYREQLARLRETVSEVSAEELAAEDSLTLVDVRETEEWHDGHIESAQHLSRGFLEMRIDSLVADRGDPVIVYCQTGIRSLFAAETLTKLGYTRVRSLSGGFVGWKEAGNPFVMPQTLSTADRTRYSRHLLIPEVGEAGQARLSTARVLVVGAGGLGCPSALYLAAAGVGHITIVDHDRVDRSNLQRQVLHTDDRIGMPKVESARRSLEALNPSVEVNALEVKIDDGNADELLAEYDVVVDGCDNFKTRYTVNDACVRLGKINIHGSIHRFEGQVSVFWPGRGPCYRCLHPQAPPADLSPNCAEAGVLGVLPGVIGMLEATETLKILLDLGEPLVGRLLTYDALAARFTEFRLSRDSDCPACGDLQPR
jgi:molybdopterin/thiamine biosynthesis adenylyltransferase/rhodanese-related sulfurtransferase